jgi:hypothetical protein
VPSLQHSCQNSLLLVIKDGIWPEPLHCCPSGVSHFCDLASHTFLMQGHDDVADIIKDDIWLRPLRCAPSPPSHLLPSPSHFISCRGMMTRQTS